MKAITIINNKHRYQNKSSMNTEISLKNYLVVQVFFFIKYKMKLILQFYKIIIFALFFVIGYI